MVQVTPMTSVHKMCRFAGSRGILSIPRAGSGSGYFRSAIHDCVFNNNTTMHSSRMRTVRCSSHRPGGLVVSAQRGGGVYLGRCLPRGCLPRGVYRGSLPRGCTPPVWTEFLTHAYENITFLQLRLRTVTSSCPYLAGVLLNKWCH